MQDCDSVMNVDLYIPHFLQVKILPGWEDSTQWGFSPNYASHTPEYLFRLCGKLTILDTTWCFLGQSYHLKLFFNKFESEEWICTASMLCVMGKQWAFVPSRCRFQNSWDNDRNLFHMLHYEYSPNLIKSNFKQIFSRLREPWYTLIFLIHQHST